MSGGTFSMTSGFWAGAGSFCAPDINGNGTVNVSDLLAVINGWGTCANPCPPYCGADINDDCIINVSDLLAVINGWGACP